MPVTSPAPYPPAAPTISGETLSVSVFLKTPGLVQKALTDLSTQRFLADRLFRAGPSADAGAVIYDQITAADLFTARDVQAIEPNAEFPILNEAAPTPLIALVTKWGGSAVLSYEEERRDRRDLFRRNLIKLRNTIIRKVDSVAVATLLAAPLNTQTASASWATVSTDIIGDVETAKNSIDKQDLGYIADTVIFNPTQALGARLNTGLRSALPRENTPKNLIFGAAVDLNGVLGLDWFASNRIAAGTVVVADSTQLGFISDEIPGPYTRIVDEQTRERYRIMAARVPTMGVTDPKAAVKITGA